MKKRVFIGITIIVLLVLVASCIYLWGNNKKYSINEDDICIGKMYYSHMLGSDAGTNYTISIYYNNEKVYKYEISQGKITIAGYDKGRKIKGIINSENDLFKLDEKYKKINNFSETSFKYIGKDNNEIENIDDFVEEVFKYKNYV